jgi:hypothetical protein
VHKGKLLDFLESVDALGGYVVREPMHNARQRYDADSLAILPPSHQKDLVVGLQTWRCAGVSVACAMAGMDEVRRMGPRPVPWLHRMLGQLGDLDEEVRTPPLDLAECRAAFEVLLLDFFVQPAEHLHPKLVADPHGRRALFQANDEFMVAFRQFANVLQLDTAGMRAAYAADRPFYVEAPAGAASALPVRSAPGAGGVQRALLELQVL